MRGMSKAAKAEAYDALARERDVHREFVWLIANGYEPDAVETVEHDGDTYEFKLYGARRLCGGLAVKVFKSPGQSHSVEIWYFDDWFQTMRNWPYGDFYTECKIAAERLSVARHRIFECEQATTRDSRSS